MHVSTKKGEGGLQKSFNKGTGGEKRGPSQTPYFTWGKLQLARVSLLRLNILIKHWSAEQVVTGLIPCQSAGGAGVKAEEEDKSFHRKLLELCEVLTNMKK